MKTRVYLPLIGLCFLAVACNAPTSVQESITTATVSSSTTSASRFAAGTRMVKINTHDLSGGSFAVPSVVPAPTAVPVGFPGYDGGTAQYRPGVSATTFYDADGVSLISKPSWLLDFQLGMTALPGTTTCATFGGSGNADVSGYFRTSEVNCAAATNVGTGNTLSDRAFMRIVLDRTASSIGTMENLLIQIEYQASGIRSNSDGANALPENNLDQLWKIFWNNSLSGNLTPNVFSVFVPPLYGACIKDGTGLINGAGAAAAPGDCLNGYKGAPITTKQIIIPLSAYPTLSVLQFSRMKGRINNTDTFPVTAPSPGPVNYVAPFFAPSGSSDCQTDSPLCMGLVIRSVLLMRM